MLECLVGSNWTSYLVFVLCTVVVLLIKVKNRISNDAKVQITGNANLVIETQNTDQTQRYYTRER